MKRLIYVVSATALLSLTLSACGGSDSELENNVDVVDNSNNNMNGNVAYTLISKDNIIYNTGCTNFNLPDTIKWKMNILKVLKKY